MKSLLHYQLRSAALRQGIIKQGFWVHRLLPYGTTKSYQEEYDYWFAFWMALPDSPAIQTDLFDELCNLMDDLMEEQLEASSEGSALENNKEKTSPEGSFGDDIPF